jgi:hypothetical protein
VAGVRFRLFVGAVVIAFPDERLDATARSREVRRPWPRRGASPDTFAPRPESEQADSSRLL